MGNINIWISRFSDIRVILDMFQSRRGMRLIVSYFNVIYFLFNIEEKRGLTNFVLFSIRKICFKVNFLKFEVYQYQRGIMGISKEDFYRFNTGFNFQ